MTCALCILRNKDISINRTAFCGANGVLTTEVSLYRTAYCGPSGVLNIEVSLYRTVWCGPSGVLITEVSLYRTVWCGPSGVLIIEVSLYRTVWCGPSGVLITEVSLYRTVWCGPSGVLIIEVSMYRTVCCGPSGDIIKEVLLNIQYACEDCSAEGQVGENVEHNLRTYVCTHIHYNVYEDSETCPQRPPAYRDSSRLPGPVNHLINTYYNEACLVHTSKGTQNQYLLSGLVYVCTYMRYTQGQNEKYLLSWSMYWTRYLLSGLVYVHEVYTGTE